MFKNLFFNIGAKVIVIIFQFTALILTNHIIGPEGRGIYLAVITWCVLLYNFSNLSLSTGILNLANKNIRLINNLAYTSTLAAFFLGFGTMLGGLLLYRFTPGLFANIRFPYLLTSLATIPFMMLQQYSMSVVQVKGNFRQFNFMYASYAVFNLSGVIIIWVIYKISLETLICINFFAWLFAGIIAFYYLWPFIKKRSRNFSIIKKLMATSTVAHFGPIVSVILTRSDILIVNYFTNEKQTGIYGLAVGIAQILLIIPLGIQNLLYHSLMGKTKDAQKGILLQYSRITFAAMVICSISLMLLSRPLVYIVGGENFIEAIPLFKYFLPGIIFYAMPMVLGTQWNIIGIFRQVNISLFFVLIIAITSNILLLPLIGITGGAVTFLFTSIINFCIHVWFIKRNMGSTPLKDVIILKQQDVPFLFKRKLNYNKDVQESKIKNV